MRNKSSKIKKRFKDNIVVKNADGETDTSAEVLIRNEIGYTPKVSVIVPVYNTSAYLRECLDSIINQTLKEIEVICVDDGSVDGSLDILKEYAKKDKRFTIITQQNTSAGAARNAGLAVAKGEYLSFLDSDDFFAPEMLEETYNVITKDETDVCIYSGVQKDYKENKILPLPWLCQAENGIIHTNIVKGKIFFITSPNCWNKLFSRRIIDRYNLRYQNLSNGNDIYFSYMAVILSDKISILNKNFVTYRYNTGKQITANLSQMSPLNMYKALLAIKEQTLKYRDKTWIDTYYYMECIYLMMYQKKTSPKTFEKVFDTYKSLFDSKHKNLPHRYFCISTDIPVVFACNKSYSTYLTVAILSLIKNCSKDNLYKLFVLHTELSEQEIQTLENLSVDNVIIKCIDVNKYIEGLVLPTSIHLSKEAYYRILIPEILNEYKKVLYLDCDIVIQRDVAELYNEDIGNNVLGAVINPSSPGNVSYINKNIKIDYKKYFNSGVLIFNNETFRKNSIKEKCLSLMVNIAQYVLLDQDLLNIACLNKVKYLDVKWNYIYFFANSITILPEFAAIYNKCKTPYIIHYASGRKPWNDYPVYLGEYWWKYAKKSPYYKKFKQELAVSSPEKRILQQLKSYRLDIKNVGNSENTVKVLSDKPVNVTTPAWFTDNQGKGVIVEGCRNRVFLQIKTERKGKLVIYFKASFKVIRGVRFPFWIDYTSIQINGREILSQPVAVWHDKPFRYEMPVEDGQDVYVAFETRYHQYSKWELQSVIFALNVDNSIILKKIRKLRKSVAKKIKRQKTSKIFSITKSGNRKVIYFLGLKLTFRNKCKELQERLKMFRMNSYMLQNKLEKIQGNTNKIMLKNYDYFKNLNPSYYQEELEAWSKRITGKRINLDNPKTYCEKIQWSKLYDSTPLKTRLTDKYLVRDWVKEKIGEKYLIPLLGVYDKFDDIDFNQLPNQFVIKTNHGSGWVIVVKDKRRFDKENAREKINGWMASNYAYYAGLELHYRDIKPKIIIEQYIENEKTDSAKSDVIGVNGDLLDYKVMCFHGKAHYIWVNTDRETGQKRDIFTTEWKRAPFRIHYPVSDRTLPKPERLDEMLKISEILAQDFNQVRIDFYILNDGDIKFGEMTFTSESGLSDFIPETWNKKLGDLFCLPQDKYILK